MARRSGAALVSVLACWGCAGAPTPAADPPPKAVSSCTGLDLDVRVHFMPSLAMSQVLVRDGRATYRAPEAGVRQVALRPSRAQLAELASRVAEASLASLPEPCNGGAADGISVAIVVRCGDELVERVCKNRFPAAVGQLTDAINAILLLDRNLPQLPSREALSDWERAAAP